MKNKMFIAFGAIALVSGVYRSAFAVMGEEVAQPTDGTQMPFNDHLAEGVPATPLVVDEQSNIPVSQADQTTINPAIIQRLPSGLEFCDCLKDAFQI